MKRLCSLVLLLGCTHSESFDNPDRTVGQFNTGNDLTLTLNPDQDYWPVWTPDGKGIVYSYVDQERRLHRCLGMLSPSGGTRIWQLCDNRAQRDDSTNSYTGYAIDSAGRLLVAEAVSRAHSPFTSLPQRFTLWLADTARPYARTQLAVLPLAIGGTNVHWLSSIAWTGANTFIALGQQLLPVNADSVFAVSDGIVLHGTIAGNHASLEAIPGTLGATGYSLAEGGATIAFTTRHELRVFRVPVAGGVPVPAIPVRDDTLAHQHGELIGITCRAATCLVSKAPIILAGDYWVFRTLPPVGWTNQSDPGSFLLDQSLMELHQYSLISGADQVIRTSVRTQPLAAPQLSPITGDLVMQVGGGWGHLQTFVNGGPNGTLHLYKGFLP